MYNHINVNFLSLIGESLKKLSLLVILLFGCTGNQGSFHLSEETYYMWQEFIKPTKDELAWAEIPWRSSFYDGLMDSGRIKGKSSGSMVA